MAYVSKELKAKIAAKLKKVMPKGWKYSLAVRHHMTIVMTIQSAPVDLIEEISRVTEDQQEWYVQLNQYWLENYLDESLELFKKIKSALNTDNYDNSDVQTDYFDVGHYVGIHIGKWNKPFQVK